MTIDQAQEILEHNRQVYAQIAQEFEQTRRELHWPVLEEFAKKVNDGDRVLDVGCGSGRLLNYLKDKRIEYVGIDTVGELLEEARHTPLCPPYGKGEIEGVKCNINFQLGDILSIPFPDQSFDHVFAIAVLHHIPSTELRVKALKEIARVLKPAGTLFMTNWNLWGSKYRIHVVRTWLKRTQVFLRSQFVPVFHDRVISGQNSGDGVVDLNNNRRLMQMSWIRGLEWNDVLVPWKHTYWRYYHAFTKRELNVLLKKAGFRHSCPINFSSNLKFTLTQATI